MSDHREVERLFDILKNKPGDRLNALPLMATLLLAHSRAEEAEVYPAARDEAGIADDVEHSQEEHLAAEQVLLAEVYPAARDEAGIADDVEHSQEEHLAAEQVLERLMDTDPASAEF